MKVNIEIDCTPEEARSFMGLPDVGKANAVYVDMMSKAMQGVSDTEKLQEYDKVKRLYQDHQVSINEKLVEIMSGRAARHVKAMMIVPLVHRCHGLIWTGI